MAHVNTIVVALALCIILTSFGVKSNKYKEKSNVNSQKLNTHTPFRMNKLNTHWQIAMKKLSQTELQNLYADFAIQDKMELEWKKRKSGGYDEQGEEEAALRRKLNALLKQYGLLASSVNAENNDVPHEDFRFNKALKVLWKKAKMAGFDETELESLMEEFKHYEEKMKEIDDLKNEIDELNDANFLDNTIDGHLEGKERKATVQSKQREMKLLHKSLQKDYAYMESITEDDNRHGDFSNPRVINIWNEAQKANFTDDELPVFKEELRHFEHKLKKQEHLRKQLELAAFDDPEKSNFVDQEKLAEKVDQYDRKVKKIHSSLKMKLQQRQEL